MLEFIVTKKAGHITLDVNFVDDQKLNTDTYTPLAGFSIDHDGKKTPFKFNIFTNPGYVELPKNPENESYLFCNPRNKDGSRMTFDQFVAEAKEFDIAFNDRYDPSIKSENRKDFYCLTGFNTCCLNCSDAVLDALFKWLSKDPKWNDAIKAIKKSDNSDDLTFLTKFCKFLSKMCVEICCCLDCIIKTPYGVIYQAEGLAPYFKYDDVRNEIIGQMQHEKTQQILQTIQNDVLTIGIPTQQESIRVPDLGDMKSSNVVSDVNITVTAEAGIGLGLPVGSLQSADSLAIESGPLEIPDPISSNQFSNLSTAGLSTIGKFGSLNQKENDSKEQQQNENEPSSPKPP